MYQNRQLMLSKEKLTETSTSSAKYKGIWTIPCHLCPSLLLLQKEKNLTTFTLVDEPSRNCCLSHKNRGTGVPLIFTWVQRTGTQSKCDRRLRIWSVYDRMGVSLKSTNGEKAQKSSRPLRRLEKSAMEISKNIKWKKIVGCSTSEFLKSLNLV